MVIKMEQKCLLLLSVVLIIIVYFIYDNKKNNQNNEGFIESLDIGYPGMKNHYGYYQSNIYKHNKLHNIGGVMDNNMINKVSDNENKVIKKENELNDLIKQNKKLENEEWYIKKIPENGTIKSQYNGDSITIEPVGDDKFKVLVNNKCITVIGNKEYELKNCEAGQYGQYFTRQKVNENDESKYYTGYEVNSDNNYPYDMVISKIPPYHCLTTGNDMLSVEECNGNNLTQQWQLNDRVKNCSDSRSS
jgi:hypothetical protein